MNVNILSSSRDPLDIMYLACKVCTSDKTIADEWWSNKSADEHIKLITKVVKSGHLGILEHVHYTFAIDGITRACANQLTRYRQASFCQQSLRSVKLLSDSEIECILEESQIDICDAIYRIFGEEDEHPYEYETYSVILKRYAIALNSGMKPEDARQFLPLATRTNLVMTVNLRELAHMCNQRLCNRAQAEIRELFEAIRETVLRDTEETEPKLYDLYDSLLVPQCKALGYCPESKSCGKMEGRVR